MHKTMNGGMSDLTKRPRAPGSLSVHLRLSVSLATPVLDTTCTRAAGVVRNKRMETDTTSSRKRFILWVAV